MPQFSHIETFTDLPVNLISGIGDMLITEHGGNRMLYAATRAGGGVVAFDIDAGMVVADQLTFNVASQLPVAPTLDLCTANGNRYLVVSGSNQTTMLSYRVEATGTIGGIFKPAGGPVGVISAQSVLDLDGTSYFYAARANDGSVCAYRMAANGTLTLLQDLALAPDLQGVSIADMIEVTAGGNRFLAVAAPGDDRITLLRVAADGRLSLADSIGAANGLGIADPGEMRVLSAYGASYLLVASASSSSMTVLAVSAEGALRVTDHLIDTLDTRFQAVSALEGFAWNGRSFVLAGGGDGGLGLFELLPDGRLVLAAQMLDTPGMALEAITALAVQVTATGIEVFVGGEGTGITRLSLHLAALAAPQLGSAAADTMSGSGSDDLIWAGAGDDLLQAGAGADTLADGAGSDQLYGGAGADLFVLAADGATDRIRDFQPGLDRLDLSAWGRVYDLAELGFSATSYGARVTFGAEVLEIYASNGLPMSLVQLQAAAPFALWHQAVGIPTGSGEIIGGEGDDFLAGSLTGGLTFLALGGNDTMSGGQAGNLFDGGAGVDLVTFADAGGGVLADLSAASQAEGGDRSSFVSVENVDGSLYNDTILGNAGANLIQGNAGHDLLQGQEGADTLRGGVGDDTLVGGAGSDVLDGGAGGLDWASYADATAGLRADLMTAQYNTGFAAGDLFASIEAIAGSAHADQLMGDQAGNVLSGAGGDDALFGRAGNDTCLGGAGNDTIYGGFGADLIDGGEGLHDIVRYDDSATGLCVDLVVVATSTGIAQGDRFLGVEDLAGSRYDDTLLGTQGANSIFGASGNDLILGRDGDDVLFGNDGNDRLVGGAGADTLYGGDGAADRALYGDASAGLRLDLLLPQRNTGPAQGDVLSGIEVVEASNYADTLLGDSLANCLIGLAGDDVLYGRDGNDGLFGGGGNDILFGGAGADRLDGGAGLRDRAAYSDATAALRVDLLSGANNTGQATGDIFLGIEDLGGSTYDDTLLGDHGGNILIGDNGNDRLFGRAGDDTLIGGAGNDTLFGMSGKDTLNGGAGADVFAFIAPAGAADADRLADFSAAEDLISLENSVFVGLSEGVLAPDRFCVGTAATTAAQRILYDRATGQIYFDRDGNGGAAQLLFAVLAPGIELDASDFLIV
jgi:Ca2+-binding RTX toxin-like protein